MLAKLIVGSRCIQNRPAHRGPRTVVTAVVSAPDRTETSPAIRTSMLRSGGNGGLSSSSRSAPGSAPGSDPASCSIQITASCDVASVTPCLIFTPPVRCQTSYEPSVHRDACVALIVTADRGSAVGTSIRPASAMAAASPRAGSAANAPAVAVSLSGCPPPGVCAITDQALQLIEITVHTQPANSRHRRWRNRARPRRGVQLARFGGGATGA